MNERIKELAKEAGLKWKEQPPHYSNTNNPIDFPVSANRDLEKFTELLILECARIAELKEQGYKDYDPDMSVGWYIRQHFGVE